MCYTIDLTAIKPVTFNLDIIVDFLNPKTNDENCQRSISLYCKTIRSSYSITKIIKKYTNHVTFEIKTTKVETLCMTFRYRGKKKILLCLLQPSCGCHARSPFPGMQSAPSTVGKNNSILFKMNAHITFDIYSYI